MEKQDADFIWSLLPEWVKEYEENLDPTFYGTGSCEGDNSVNKKVRKILYGKEEENGIYNMYSG